MKLLIKYIGIVFIILFVASGLIALFDTPFKEASIIPLSELVTRINAETVKQITVSGDELLIVFTDDTTAIAKKESGVSALETLANAGADREKISKINISVEQPSGLSVILSSLLPALLPFLLLLAIF